VISIIDYGLGNIQAIINVYNRLNIKAKTVRSASELEECSKLILPGVGSFDHAMEKFNNSGMRDSIEQLVIEKETPILGICVGMQMLANSSEEGKLSGLGWIDGEVKKFDKSSMLINNNLPHMGWNSVTPKTDEELFKEMQENISFYFLHSYFFQCNKGSNIIGTSHYGYEFSSAIKNKNIMGVQFHPEKSHHFGVQLLKNYSEI
jgi:glutamine amidotransferase